ncbi:MAG TPA: sulfurtransferase TusA family protein, partial [Spirochaetia bacterium]|nr:sulfurtransferase TusA family protein [Spirochaetia bacterium]
MRKTIDAKGLACPQPVILCRKALREADLDEIEMVVDNEAARQNVIRFLKFVGAAEPVVESRGPVHAILARVSVAMRDKARAGAPAPGCEDQDQGVAPGEQFAAKTMLLSSDQVGRGDEDLGRLLVRGFL